MIIPTHSVVIDGNTAFLVARAIERAAAAGLLDDVPPRGRELLGRAHTDCNVAGRRALGLDDPFPDRAGKDAAPAVPASWITSSAAAERLGISRQRIGQIADRLGGQLVGNRWLFDPQRVEEYKSERLAG